MREVKRNVIYDHQTKKEQDCGSNKASFEYQAMIASSVRIAAFITYYDGQQCCEPLEHQYQVGQEGGMYTPFFYSTKCESAPIFYSPEELAEWFIIQRTPKVKISNFQIRWIEIGECGIGCQKCNDSGVIETGNNDLPCDCPSGNEALFSVAGVIGLVTGKEMGLHFLNGSPRPIELEKDLFYAYNLPGRK